MLWLFIICLIVSSIGFYKYVYFISLGYGFSIAVMAIYMLININTPSIINILLCLLLLCYGCRLGGYLLLREIKSSSYRKTMKKEIKDGKNMKLYIKASIWISCALLYICQVSPIYFRIAQNNPLDILSIVGLIIMISGITIESIADLQKSKAKKENPNRFCDKGLYKIVRCPNYLGEILLWTGVFISGIKVYSNIIQLLIALIGYLCIVYIMFGGARRLEIRQNRNYGKDKEYQNYIKSTPIIIPFIPLYSVEKYKWLIG